MSLSKEDFIFNGIVNYLSVLIGQRYNKKRGGIDV